MIIHNRIRCNKCEKVIESHHRHDFVWCDCDNEEYGGCAVDGGKDYLRRVGEDYTEMSVYDEEDEGKVELVEKDGEKSMETLTPLIMDLDEEPEPELTKEERVEKLSPKDRLIHELQGLVQTLKETVLLHEAQGVLISEVRKTIQGANKQLDRNVSLYGGEPSLETVMKGEWIAIPRDNFDLLRVILGSLGTEEEK